MRLSTALFKMIFVSLTLAALFACSNGSSSAPSMTDAAGKHVVSLGYTNWVQQHWVVYKQLNGGSSDVTSLTQCSECHGADLSGGSAKVSCFTASFEGTSCHANADGTLGHPSDWGDNTAPVNFHGKVVKGSTTLAADCGLCHATVQNGVSVSTAPSCFATDQAMACHFASPSANSTACISCHSASPTGPGAFGPVTVRPNLAGTHAEHISNLHIGCNACHWKGGSGTTNHAVNSTFKNNVVYLNLSTGYLAESGTYQFNPGTGVCSAVACHGGIDTPSWYGGTFSADPVGQTQQASTCKSCHQYDATVLAANPQYNAAVSGKPAKLTNAPNLHMAHLNSNQLAIDCIDCHDTTLNTMANHPTGLSTPALDVQPETTLGNMISAYTKYTDATKTVKIGTCSSAAACHFGAVQQWYP